MSIYMSVLAVTEESLKGENRYHFTSFWNFKNMEISKLLTNILSMGCLQSGALFTGSLIFFSILFYRHPQLQIYDKK